MFSYGTLTPATFQSYGTPTSDYPDLFKFYTCVPTRSTESTAANQRRPVLYTSLNGGVRWCYESQNNSNNFYNANYCGNFYFNSDKYHLEAWAHRSSSSSYSSYKAVCGDTDTQTGIKVGKQNSWTTSSAVAYNTTSLPNREIFRNAYGTNSSRYFSIRDGSSSSYAPQYCYNNSPWGTASWTATSFGVSSQTFSNSQGFKQICINPEVEHEALIYYLTGGSGTQYLRTYLVNLDTMTSPIDYTTEIWGTTTRLPGNYSYVSFDYLPGVGYLIIYWYNGNNSFTVRILRTFDPITHEPLQNNQYVCSDAMNFGDANSKPKNNGQRGFYCPWTKEYFYCPNAKQLWWTTDGENWTKSASDTSASATTNCQKFLTDGTSMVIATSGSAFYYSRDKGQTWINDYTLSPNGFNTNKSNDTIVLPFKCINNIGINTSDLVLEKTIDNTTGEVVDSPTNFYLNGFIPVDPNTSYVFYGACKTPHDNISEKQKTWYNRILYYDSSYNFISGKEGADYTTTGSPNREVPCIFTSPSNAAYAKVTCNMENVTATQAIVDSYKWYFAKEDDFKVMTEYGDIVMN